eukprot:scaffold526669_cov19-Prasinocladus_malaysianus.AAC.1
MELTWTSNSRDSGKNIITLNLKQGSNVLERSSRTRAFENNIVNVVYHAQAFRLSFLSSVNR